MRDWDLIVATLAVFGSANRILGTEAQRRVREQADGFGRMSLAQLDELGITFDWSHVRDSSDAGKRRVADAIRAELREMDRQREARFPELVGTETHESLVIDVVQQLGTTVPA